MPPDTALPGPRGAAPPLASGFDPRCGSRSSTSSRAGSSDGSPRIRAPGHAARRAARRAVAAAGLAGLALLAGCADTTDARYARTLANYQAAGLMRTDIDPPDAPFGNADLIRDFERIAFHMEFESATSLVSRATAVELVKWRGPIRWKVTGDGVREQDLEAYRDLTARISRLTGLEFQEVGSDPDIFILIASGRVRDQFVAQMLRNGGGGRISLIEEWARNDVFPCVGQVGRSKIDGRWKNQATIAIKDELRGVLRLSCIHEELVQTLGLLNDDPDARPSIFNDDQEFALLTRHDEYLLRILYDPRLRAGMTAEEGMPIVREIVAEIGPGPSPATPATLAPPTPATIRTPTLTQVAPAD
ncbi:MAG: hypothetical protein CML46_21260 [Rhodobacteraceae bacterium]|nr:hypothetical protein [Paracoccaceae bacterium]MBR29442.1 hypothetical protein [Paracoccaceae bacterium]